MAVTQLDFYTKDLCQPVKAAAPETSASAPAPDIAPNHLPRKRCLDAIAPTLARHLIDWSDLPMEGFPIPKAEVIDAVDADGSAE